MGEAMRDPSVSAAYSGNWYLMVLDAMTKARKTTDEWLDAVLVAQGLLDLTTKAQMEEWQKNAAALPDAGKTMKDKESNMNGKGIALNLGVGLTAAGLAGLAALGLTLSPFGIGLVILAAVVAVLTISLSIQYTAGQDNKTFMNVVDAHAEYDSAIQLHQNSLVQQAQTAVQNTMQSKQQNVTQYFNPAADTKQQTASMVQNALASFKAMIWSAA